MPEERYRFTVRLSQDTERIMKKAMLKDNCQSQNEFTENAIRFYAGYIATKDASEYLVPVLTQVLRGQLDGFAAHINRNIFRLSVEEAKTWNIIAGLIRVGPEKLNEIHNKAIGEVLRLKGTLTYEQLYKDPISLEYDLDIDGLIRGEIADGDE